MSERGYETQTRVAQPENAVRVVTLVHVLEEIPAPLQREVDAALAWLSAEQGRQFKLTGVVDPELAERSSGEPHTLTLIVCEGDQCLREQVRVRAVNGDFEISRADNSRKDSPAELDPLPGVRKDWLERAMTMHSFVVLVFYRGFW